MKFIALWLSIIMIILFIFQQIIPTFTDLLILNQQSWFQPYRFLTTIFLHGSLAHLVYNLFALLIFGLILEKITSTKNFLIIFFTTGIIANLISVNFYNSSLGASGAIMGIIGAIAIIRPKMMVWAFGAILPMWIAAILWIIGDTLGIFMPSNVGNIAHLSGIAMGILAGLYLRLKYKAPPKTRQQIKIPETYMKDWEKIYME